MDSANKQQRLWGMAPELGREWDNIKHNSNRTNRSHNKTSHSTHSTPTHASQSPTKSQRPQQFQACLTSFIAPLKPGETNTIPDVYEVDEHTHKASVTVKLHEKLVDVLERIGDSNFGKKLDKYHLSLQITKFRANHEPVPTKAWCKLSATQKRNVFLNRYPAFEVYIACISDEVLAYICEEHLSFAFMVSHHNVPKVYYEILRLCHSHTLAEKNRMEILLNNGGRTTDSPLDTSTSGVEVHSVAEEMKVTENESTPESHKKRKVNETLSNIDNFVNNWKLELTTKESELDHREQELLLKEHALNTKEQELKTKEEELAKSKIEVKIEPGTENIKVLKEYTTEKYIQYSEESQTMIQSCMAILKELAQQPEFEISYQIHMFSSQARRAYAARDQSNTDSVEVLSKRATEEFGAKLNSSRAEKLGKEILEFMEKAIKEETYKPELVECFTINNTDKRIPLRGKTGIRAVSRIPSDTILGIYNGKMWLNVEYQEHCAKDIQNWVYRESYVFDLKIQEFSNMVIDSSQKGNELRFTNDPHINPFENYEKGKRIAASNIEFMEVVFKGWPYILAITTRQIPKHEEILWDYKATYWDGLKEPARKQEAVQHKLSELRDALSIVI